MKWINAIFEMQKIKATHTRGFRVILLSLLSFTVMVNDNAGTHLSFGVGIATLEAGVQLSHWKSIIW